MRQDRLERKRKALWGGLQWLILGLLLWGLSSAAWAQMAPSPQRAEPTPEQEIDEFTFPPLTLDPRIYSYDNLWVRILAQRVGDGSASMQERRAFYYLYERLFPFDKPLPANWQLAAAQIRKSLKAKEEASSSWTLLGPAKFYSVGGQGTQIPNSGRATALWFDPANKNTIILGTADGGVWKTTDQGSTWTSIFDAGPNLSIGSLAVDPANKSVIYIATGEGNFSSDGISGSGIFKTTNGGASWTNIPLPWVYVQPNNTIRRIVVDPRNSQKLYAAADGGIFISSNGGASWTVSTISAPNTPPFIGTDVVLDSVTPAQGQPSIAYAALGCPYQNYNGANVISRSTDGGNSWQVIGQPQQPIFGRITLLLAPSNPRRLYALVQYFQQSDNVGTVWYADNADTGSPQFAGNLPSPNFCATQCSYDITGVVDPTNPDKIFLGGVDSYVSMDKGATTTKISTWNAYDTPAGYSHADHHHMLMPDSSTIYDANDGGFFVGTVSGTNVTWTSKNIGLPTLQYYSLCQHPSDPTKFQGGLQDNGHAFFDGANGYMVAGGDGGDSAWDQTDPNYAYEEYVYAYISRNSTMGSNAMNFQCIRNFGGCSDCNNFVCNPDSRTAFIAPFALDPTDQKILYTGSNKIYKNADARNTNSWTAISNDLTGDQTSWISAIHPAKNNGQIGTIYVGTLNGKVQVTSNGGGTWTDRSAGLAQATVKAFATNPQDASKVLVALSGYQAQHIYMSVNAGAVWTDITGGLPAIPFNTIALDPNDVNHAFAGADQGVFENRSVWTGGAWTDATANLPLAAVFELEFNPTNRRLRAATHGRSVWELGGGSTQCTVTCTATAPATGTAGSAVTFSSTATPSGCTGSPTYSWTFGDSQTSSSQNPSHTYSAAGTYSWGLTVTVDGQTCTRSGSITISGGGGGKKAGDCDGNGTVSITELQQVVNNQLGVSNTGCGDCDGNSQVSITELQKTVNCQLGATCDTNCQH